MRLLLNIINIPPDLSSLLSELSNTVNEGKSEEWWQKINLPGQKKIKVMQWTTWEHIIHRIPLATINLHLYFSLCFVFICLFSQTFSKYPKYHKMGCFMYGNICSSCMIQIQLRFERHLTVHQLFLNMWGAQNHRRQC